MPILYGFTGPVDLLPGGHVVVFGSWEMGLEGRRRGLELRDTLLVVGPSGPPRFAFLFRRDLSGSTVVETVLKYGTGGLNVDGCRVGSTKRVPGGLSRNARLPKSLLSSLRRETGEESAHNPNVGRWPTNLVFVHAEGCKRDGVKTSGQETIPNWICVEDCPVRALDEQSLAGGIHSAGSARDGLVPVVAPRYNAASYEWSANRTMPRLGDSGGASRFFPQFENEAALVTWLKILIGDIQ